MKSQVSLADNIARELSKRHCNLSNTQGDSSKSRFRKYSLRFARFVNSTKDLGMGLARLDPHHVAPIVLGGVYTLVQIVTSDSEDHRHAILTTLEIVETIAQWNHVEVEQILRNKDPNLTELFEKLGSSIKNLYQEIIVLLATMMIYFSKNKWRECSINSKTSTLLTTTI